MIDTRRMEQVYINRGTLLVRFLLEQDHSSQFSRSSRVPTRHNCRRPLCRVLGALGKASQALGKDFAECRTRQRSLGKDFVGKNFFAECKKSTLGKAFAECPTLGKVGTEKTPKKQKFLPKKRKICFNWWRPPPVSAHPSPAFFA